MNTGKSNLYLTNTARLDKVSIMLAEPYWRQANKPANCPAAGKESFAIFSRSLTSESLMFCYNARCLRITLNCMGMQPVLK